MKMNSLGHEMNDNLKKRKMEIENALRNVSSHVRQAQSSNLPAEFEALMERTAAATTTEASHLSKSLELGKKIKKLKKELEKLQVRMVDVMSIGVDVPVYHGLTYCMR